MLWILSLLSVSWEAKENETEEKDAVKDETQDLQEVHGGSEHRCLGCFVQVPMQGRNPRPSPP